MCLEIKHQIVIKNTQENVWKILTDFEDYEKWNPFLIEVKRLDNKRLKVVSQMGKSKTEFQPEILIEEPPRELRWVGRLMNLPFLFTGEHFFVLEGKGKETLFTHGEKFSGILAYLMWPFIKNSIDKNFRSLEAALQHKAEG